MPNDGYYRLFSRPDIPAPAIGWTSQDFAWTFTLNGGPTPTSTFFLASDVKVHIQPLSSDWTNDGLSCWVNPSVPEPCSLTILVAGMTCLGGFLRRRII